MGDMKMLMEEAPASAPGFHNINFSASQERLVKGQAYKDLSTVVVIPTLGKIPARVVQSWMSLMMPMNQKSVRLFVEDMEVGAAYQWAVETILAHPQLSKFKYMLTLEEDNLPPPDGLLKLYEDIGKYAAIGGLYWTKGPGGQPMCYGDPKEILNFRPQVPEANTVQECNGLGMGFTLFKIDIFRQIEPPWFVTEQSYSPTRGGSAFTQDLYFFNKLREQGLKVACDSKVLVGHLDTNEGIVW